MVKAQERVTDEDERFPGGMNYLDWLMNVLKPDELTPQNLDQIVAYVRRDRDRAESGIKAKKADYSPKLDKLMKKILKPKPRLGVRPL